MGSAEASEPPALEIAAAEGAVSPETGTDPPPSEFGAGRLRIHGCPLGDRALTALFPEFTTGKSLAGLAVWRVPRGGGRMRARAGSLGVPLLTLGRGLLRAPPQYRAASAVLSVTAVAMLGPHSSADVLSPDRLLASRGWETAELIERAKAARRELVSRRAGGSWWGRGALPRGEGIALVDGEALDSSRSEPLLRAMLAEALAENPADKVVLLVAPGLRRSEFYRAAVSRGCIAVTAPVDPWAAVERADRLYTVGGETGFIGLLAGRDVRCFGNAFYSGWGATRDAQNVVQRPFRRDADEIFAGACLVATRCLDPYRQTPAPFEDVASILSDWRKIDKGNRRVAVCVGMSFWKRRRVADFFRSSVGVPAFRRGTKRALAAASAQPGGAVAVWASRAPKGFVAAAERRQIPIVWVEDGFVRSVGLGSDFVPAASLVLDGGGMHYNPRVETDLQRLLLRTEFDDRMIRRARSLIAQLVARGITKYSSTAKHDAGAATLSLGVPRGRRRILVPGQVEDDLSVLFNSDEIRGNLDLLRRVRTANPDAVVFYKPHPDVDAGHRIGAIPDAVARDFADSVVRGVSTAALLGEIDELHTLTSLAGFEALLRCRRVVCYGRPFYAGWGLTTDLAPIERGRRLALEELVAGALILYPRYLDPVTRLPCPPEIVVERLDDPSLWHAGPLVAGRRIQGLLARRWAELTGRKPASAKVVDG